MTLIPRSAAGSWRLWRSAILALPLLISCSDRSTTSPAGAPTGVASHSTSAARAIFVVEPGVLNVPTYDGSGQSVHPDVVAFDDGWRGARYWLTMTPYPHSDQHLENPSILRSDDGITMQVPAGLTNPVIKPPRKSQDYNSDPELLYEARSDRLVLFHRFVEKNTNTLRMSTSGDGVKWTTLNAPFWEHAHNMVSPTIAPRSDAVARMWYVEAGKAGCDAKTTSVVTRRAADASGGFVDTKWGEKVVTDLSIPGYDIWHIKARWIPSKSEYWMLISAFPVNGNGCKTDDLFFARSADGMHWTTYAQPILRHDDREWTAAAVYRSSFLYDQATDELSLWISARGTDDQWHMGYARLLYSSLLSSLEAGSPVGTPSPVLFKAPHTTVGQEP